MKADRPLYVDSKGVLCDTPPATGYKLAGTKGQDIPSNIVEKFGLVLRSGKITQNGKAAKSPQSTPSPIIADRDLFADKDGELFDEPQATGIKIADAGKKIPTEYIRRYSLEVKKDKVIQKKKGTKKSGPVENKEAGTAENKGARGSGGLTITDAEGHGSTSESAS